MKVKKIQKKSVKVAVCIPARDTMVASTAFDIARMSAYDSRNRDGSLSFYTVSSTLIFDARERLAAAALNDGADVILWIDSDMRFPKDVIEIMLSRNVPILGVNAVTRQRPALPTAKNFVMITENEGKWVKIDSRGKVGIEKVTAVGCGVQMTRRVVFEKTPRPWFEFMKVNNNQWVGEDVFFCVRAHDAGFDTYVDHDLSLHIGHVGQYDYRWDDCIEVIPEG
jgi:hypothetical protein